MRNYWTCSKFADWIRGTTKGGAKTSKGWHEWEQEAKAKYPIRWWIAEEGLDYLQDVWCFIPERINDVRYYINNRWITKTHALTAHPRNIKPGTWCDVGNRFLPCLFNELVDFVEVEQAWHHVIWDEEARKKYHTPWSRTFFRWRTWRCPQAGLDYLKWAMTLTNAEFLDEDKKHEAVPTYQAESAKEILELYTWWKEVYPNRPEPMEASGWSDYCDRQREKHGGKLWIGNEDETDAEREESRRILDHCHAIEKEYEQEDEAMMIRLIKVRHGLWT